MKGWLGFGKNDDKFSSDGGSTASMSNSLGSGTESSQSGHPSTPSSSSQAEGNTAAGFNRDLRGSRRMSRTDRSASFRMDRNSGNMFAAFMARPHAAADIEMERRVSLAAKNLGEGVTKIVMAAKMGGGQSRRGSEEGGSTNPDEWKIRLLQLLGGSDNDVESQNFDHGAATSDLDILLTNSPCDKFVLRCVENELPPNLIHCLRLLRVLELQHAHAAASVHRGGSGNISSISTVATSKVAKLLCLLCADPSVGEQLRPHLFGLLALSGASYPPSGAHVASAASSVILAFSGSCLTTSLVWFLHDRKMIVHMTDDIKELCGMTAVSSLSSVNLCLYGAAAEEAGLWVVALKTVVHVVASSTNHQCLELLRDFDAAGGYHVLCYAIANSGINHISKLLELVTVLLCCNTEAPAHPASSDRSVLSNDLSQSHADSVALSDRADFDPDHDRDDEMLATNPSAFEIVEDLMARSLPFLIAYVESHGGQRPDLDDEFLPELVDFSISTALSLKDGADPSGEQSPEEILDSHLLSELLVKTLQLYSDHAENYSIIEKRYNILSIFLLAFPTFSDESIKVMILKTLEYVCTGISGTDAVKPITVASQVFFKVCENLVASRDDMTDKLRNSLIMDAELLGATLDKLLQFDDSVCDVVVDKGQLKTSLAQILELVGSNRPRQNDEHATLPVPPPKSTDQDQGYSVFCRVLKIIVRQSSALSDQETARDSQEESTVDDGTSSNSRSPLNDLLAAGILSMGDVACDASLSVFEASLGFRHDMTLSHGMTCLVDCLDHLSVISGVSCGVLSGTTPFSLSPRMKKRQPRTVSLPSRVEEVSKFPLNVSVIHRKASIIGMLRNVLDINESAQDVFCSSGGYECLSRLFFCLDGAALRDSNMGAETGDTLGVGDAIVALVEASCGAISASTVSKSKAESPAGDSSTSTHAMDLLTEDDPLASTSSSSEIPAAKNRNYVRQKCFYFSFSSAIGSTGVLSIPKNAKAIVRMAMEVMEPSMKVASFGDDDARDSRFTGEKSNAHLDGRTFIRNPDAARLVLGIAVHMPTSSSGIALAKQALDEVLRLCAPDMVGSTLSQISSSGLSRSLTNRHEFASLLEDRTHHLYSRFVLLLRRITSFSMTYMDFVALLRCIAGPLLRVDDDEFGADGATTIPLKQKRIRLPVISSSVRTTSLSRAASEGSKSESWQARESDFCNRLETLSIIAERGDRVARCQMGGDSLNTVALYMQKVAMEDRLYALAEQGRIKFLEVESVEKKANAVSSGISVASGPGQGGTQEKVWGPFINGGFTYSVWIRLPPSGSTGNIFILDISSPPSDKNGGSSKNIDYVSVWYDLQNQRFNILTSSASRNEPTCFPLSPLSRGVWHHVFLTFQPPKRAVLHRKSVLSLCVDGRPLESEVKVESILLPPTARIHVGVPNPFLASSGIVRGALSIWELGPMLLVLNNLANRDATSIFAAGPDFQGIFWGDRPQRLSLAATATSVFSRLAESGEQGSVAGALRRRGIGEMESAGHVMRERGPMAGPEADSLRAVDLLCSVPAEQIICGFRASSSSTSMRDGSSSRNKRHYSRRLVNLAGVNTSNDMVSTDAVVYGNGSVISPNCFTDNVQWIGGPNVLLPLVNASRSAASMALALRLIRESVHRHPPNIEMLQAGGGYRILGLLLRQKRIMNANVLDECCAFAAHGFVPGAVNTSASPTKSGTIVAPTLWENSEKWVFADLEAMKYLLLNHQVWDLRGSGPDLPLRLLSILNSLVATKSAHAAFNSRRLHLLGIIRWTLHLMLEAAELYTIGAIASEIAEKDNSASQPNFADNTKTPPRGTANQSLPGYIGSSGVDVLSSGWYVEAPSTSTTAVGGDPGNSLLLACKTLLRRVLTFMLTPGDLEAIAGAAIYTVSIAGMRGMDQQQQANSQSYTENERKDEEDQLFPGPVARVYLIRLLEELIVDGVNEIVSSSSEKRGSQDGDGRTEVNAQPHAGGGTSSNDSYLAMAVLVRKKSQPNQDLHPKHHQAQAFLSAFAGILTPVWFACLLEGCREEASASAVLRLMILMLQSSPAFANAFEEAGGFAPLVLSIPKFSTCASITMSMLSQLLHAPILHLPCFGALDASQLCEVFDAESDATELIIDEGVQGGLHTPSDPSCGIFALLAECLGRNIQLASFPNDLGEKARRTNEAVLQLLGHRHTFSSSFQDFCRTPDFLEPLAQALCLVHDEKLQRMQKKMQENARANDSGKKSSVTPSKPATRAVQSGEEFMSWPSPDHGAHLATKQQGKRIMRRGSLSVVNTSQTPTERFVGKPEEDGEGSGIGMVELLHRVLSHAVMNGPLAAPLVSALFRSFPIHASPDQVEAFHLVLIEHCRSVVQDALQRGGPIPLANCVGVSSVLLDRLVAGFFTSEPVLEAVKISLSSLKCLAASGGYASRILANSDQSMLVADAAHVTRLTCLTALQRSSPVGPYDEGDDDLKFEVLDAIEQNLKQLLLVPSTTGQGMKRQISVGGSGYPAPNPGSRSFPIWQSASFSRCCPPTVTCTYPDLPALDEPDRAFIVALMGQVYSLLRDNRHDIQQKTFSIIVSLLQQRRGVMSELLITDIPRGDGRMETVDLMNRGGFGALLVVHEASASTSRRSESMQVGSSGDNESYAPFYEWLGTHQTQVAAVFNAIQRQALGLLPSIDTGTSTPEEAIENEQKMMLLKLTSQDSSDRTILGGLERAELAQRSHNKTAESHALWRRQGSDDLSSGAMQWKFLLRQLKGSCSIWEGGAFVDFGHTFSFEVLFSKLTKKRKQAPKPIKGRLTEDDAIANNTAAIEIVTRWKLDLTEGYERQRRRLLPNYEFFSLYNIDETIDMGDDGENDRTSIVQSDFDDHDDASSASQDIDGTVVSGTSEDDVTVGLRRGRSRRSGLFVGPHGVGEETDTDSNARRSTIFPPAGDSMEATAALLKEMHLGRRKGTNVDDDYDVEGLEVDEDDIDFDAEAGDLSHTLDSVTDGDATKTDNTNKQHTPLNEFPTHEADKSPVPKENSVPNSDLNGARQGQGTDGGEGDESGNRRDNVLASSYDLITGLLRFGDWPEKLYNVKRCTGLEVRQALLLWCRNAIYIIDGFEKSGGDGAEGGGLEGEINRLEKSNTTYYINLRPQGFTDTSNEPRNGEGMSMNLHQTGENRGEAERQKNKETQSQASSEEITYQHRSQRIAFNDLYSVYRRRYQLQQVALEFYDVHRNGTLVAFSNQTEKEEVLSRVLNTPLPNSIFSSNILGSNSTNYKKFMSSLRAKITSQWIQGRMTNFDFIMHLNSFAGRTYNDLTQYPVFPWILADYESEEIDLNDPKTYRDLSKPMGAQGDARAVQFKERYEALEGNYLNEDEPPPFHYGTHYSCAAYVLYYLMRLEPFSRLALSLQGGRFDVADRLFHNIGASWRSASTENLQDVRELIPEFFYLPQFLVNNNMFDFGITQVGKTVHHVTLPPWAKGDPKRFIRINRQALESDYVSRNLHKWADLIFGYKQRGREAVAALNTFVHVTYEGQVDLDEIKDPVQRESIVAQIQNFGQTPSRLERRPFLQRNVAIAIKEKSVDFSALSNLAALTPPFCVVGAPHRVFVRVSSWDTCRVGMIGQSDSSVGDMCLVKGQVVGVGKTCSLIVPSKRYYRFGGPNNGLSVHVAISTARHREVNKVLSIHDGMHRAPISVARPSLNGNWLVTGCMDSTVRVWKYDGQNTHLQATLCGHEGGQVTCIDMSTTFGSIITGGADGNVLVWDLRTLTFLRQLRPVMNKSEEDAEGSMSQSRAISVSINQKNGNILTLVGSSLSFFDINGALLATQSEDEFMTRSRPSCAIATDCPEWMENGVVAVTGHLNGDVRLWGLDYDNGTLVMRHLVPDRVHSCPITALRAVGDRQDTLLVGDKSGKMSICKALQLEAMSQQELNVVLQEIRSGTFNRNSGAFRSPTADGGRV